jgi:methyl-accepting chemotaxis protein
MNTLSITKKLILSFSVIVILTVGYGIFAITAQNSQVNNFNEFQESTKRSLLVNRVTAYLLQARLYVMKYRASKDISIAKVIDKNFSLMVEAQTELEGQITAPEYKEKLAQTQKDVAEYRKAFKETIDKQTRIFEITGSLDSIGPELRSVLTKKLNTATDLNDTDGAYYAGNTLETVMLTRLYASKFLKKNLEQDNQRFLEVSAEAQEMFSALISNLPSSRRDKEIIEAQEKFNLYRNSFIQAMQIIEERNALQNDRLDFLGPRIVKNIDSVLEYISKEQAALGPKIAADMRQSQKISLIITVVMIFFAALMAVVFSRYLSRRLNNTAYLTQELAEGNIEVTINEHDKEDEIGAIHRALLVFKENAIEKEKLEEQQKQAEAKAEADKKEAMHQLANSFEERVQGLIHMVSDNAQKMSDNAQNMAQTLVNSGSLTTNAANDAGNTSQSVQTIAAAAEEMAATVKEISSQIQRSNQLVSDSVNTVENAKDQASELSEASQKVQNVVELISDISGQINLLALNATIESARAGEAGKGFAVVASEVKNLASQTDQSIQEIIRVIEEMQLASQNIVTSLGNIDDSVKNISESSSSIAAAIEEQSATTNEVVHNISSASQATQQISINLNEISSGSEVAQKTSKQVLEATEDLTEKANSLNSEVGSFLSEIRAA